MLGSVERQQGADTILHNDVGLISYDAEDVASESPENRRTTYDSNTALALRASRGKKKNNN